MLKKLAMVLAAASMSLGFAGCSTIPTVVDTVVGTGPNVGARTALDDKLMYAAEAAYNVPAHAYVTADANKLMSRATKDNLKPKLQYLKQLLVSARGAYAVANTSGLDGIVKAMTKTKDDVMLLIPKPGS